MTPFQVVRVDWLRWPVRVSHDKRLLVFPSFGGRRFSGRKDEVASRHKQVGTILARKYAILL